MATAAANSAKIPPPVTNGISASKSTHATSSIASVATDQHSQLKKAAPPPPPNSNVSPNSPDYTYAIRPPPKKETPPSNITPVVPAMSSPQPSSPGSRRRQRQTEQEPKHKKSVEKSPLSVAVGGVESSTLAATQQQQTVGGAGSRPMTPDFRYTVLAEEEDESHRKAAAASSKPNGNGLSSSTNGNSFRSVSVDGGTGGQLTADASADSARRHSLTSMSAGVVSPAVSVDNPSPSGSVSDLDPESLLVLDDSYSGACSRRTSISSVDSNLGRSL